MDKTALITGGSRGLGREIAFTLGRCGYRVAINYLRERAEADKTVELVGGDAFSIRADVGDYNQVEETARIIGEKWGRLDILVNNAGISRDALVLKTTGREWDETIRVNLKGCYNTIKAFAPMMTASGGGHIINISSYSGLRGKKGQAAYSASKAAILGLTRALSMELGGQNIRVNAVLPGYMPVGMGRESPRAMKEAAEESVLGVLSDPEEAAGFIVWLSGTKSISGQVFILDSRGYPGWKGRY